MSQIQLKRLEEIFGQTGAGVILRHIDDMEGTFGSAAKTIRMILNGQDPKERTQFNL